MSLSIVECEVHFYANPTSPLASGAVGQCREFLAVSDGGQAVFRPESGSASLTASTSTRGGSSSSSTGGPRQPASRPASPLTDLESAQEDQNSTPILFLLLLPQTTCTRKHMHAHMHICTDVEPPSAPAAPSLASPCLPPSPSLF